MSGGIERVPSCTVSHGPGSRLEDSKQVVPCLSPYPQGRQGHWKVTAWAIGLASRGIVLACVSVLGLLCPAAGDDAWPLDNPAGVKRRATPHTVTALAISRDGESLVAASSHELTVYSTATLEPAGGRQLEISHIHEVRFLPRGNQLLVAGGIPGESGMVILLAWPSLDLLSARSYHADVVYACDVRSDRPELVLASADHRVSRWRLASNGSAIDQEPFAVLQGHSRAVLAAVYLANSSLIVSAGVDQTLRVWDPNDNQLQRLLDNHTATVRDLAARPFATEPPGSGLPLVASASADRTVRFWQPTIGRLVRFLKLDTEPTCLAWSTDGVQLAVGAIDGRLRLIDPESLRILADQTVGTGWLYDVVASPTAPQKYFVAGEDGLAAVTSVTP
jgi:WD40 repeat protein